MLFFFLGAKWSVYSIENDTRDAKNRKEECEKRNKKDSIENCIATYNSKIWWGIRLKINSHCGVGCFIKCVTWK